MCHTSSGTCHLRQFPMSCPSHGAPATRACGHLGPRHHARPGHIVFLGYQLDARCDGRSQNSNPNSDAESLGTGQEVGVISVGCATWASLVNTINTCIYKTKYKLFFPSKKLKDPYIDTTAFWHKLHIGTLSKSSSDIFFRYIGWSE